MADLELIYIQMFPKEGDPGWHWSGSAEDPDACQCHGAGAYNLWPVPAKGRLIFTRVTGCYRAANSAVRALGPRAANPHTPPPPRSIPRVWKEKRRPASQPATAAATRT